LPTALARFRQPVKLAFPATGVAGNRGADSVQCRDYLLESKNNSMKKEEAEKKFEEYRTPLFLKHRDWLAIYAYTVF